MNSKPLTVDAVEISDVKALDPIYVYWEDFSSGQGRITITVYGEAWTGYWGAMGNRTIKQFFAQCDDDYLATKLHGSQFQKRNAGHMKYLKRIVQAIKDYLKNV